MNTKRLLKLADFLDKLPKGKFDICSVVKGDGKPTLTSKCGSTACAIGWCPRVFPRLCKYDANLDVVVKATGSWLYHQVAEELFGLTHWQVHHLFTSGSYEQSQWSNAKAVAKRIRDLTAAE